MLYVCQITKATLVANHNFGHTRLFLLSCIQITNHIDHIDINQIVNKLIILSNSLFKLIDFVI